MSIIDKIKKNTTIKDTAILSKSKLFNEKDVIPTSIPAINIALSGKVNGGFVPGVTLFAGPSKSFKTLFSLILAKAYLDKYEDAVLLFYDTEFGTPPSYFKTLNIDTERCVHTPITDIEQLKFDTMAQLKEIERGDHVIIIIDSIGNLASKKEIDDALDQKSVADLTRARNLKSYFRMVTPHLSLKDIPLVAINHTYKEIGTMYPRDILGGGNSSVYASDNIYIIGRQQEKEGTDLVGYNFIINVEKSRYSREKSKIPITVSFDAGINKYSGLFDIALEGNFILKDSSGWYKLLDLDTGEVLDKKVRMKDISNDYFESLITNKKFNEYVESKYSITYNSIMGETPVLEKTENA